MIPWKEKVHNYHYQSSTVRQSDAQCRSLATMESPTKTVRQGNVMTAMGDWWCILIDDWVSSSKPEKQIWNVFKYNWFRYKRKTIVSIYSILFSFLFIIFYRFLENHHFFLSFYFLFFFLSLFYRFLENHHFLSFYFHFFIIFYRFLENHHESFYFHFVYHFFIVSWKIITFYHFIISVWSCPEKW